MRIALVCDWYRPRIGGIELHLEHLAGHLVAAGHEVTVVTPTPGPVELPARVSVHRLRAWRLPGIGLAWTPAAFRRLGQVLRAGQFDVVHVHSSLISPTAYAALWHAQAAGLPAVITVHSIWGGFRHGFAALAELTGWTRWPVVFSAVSERVARDLRSIIPSAPVSILPNAITAADWRLVPRPPAEETNVACVMRLAPRKRGAALLTAFARARGERPMRLRIAGDGPERRRLERRARRLGLGESVEFLGAVDQAGIKALLASSHFFVLPTVLEAFGLAALEARAAGLPVIAMRAGGAGEWLQDGVEGLLADDDEELARHLRRLGSDLAWCAAIAAHNRATPVAFTWERSLAAHFAAYARARSLRPA